MRGPFAAGRSLRLFLALVLSLFPPILAADGRTAFLELISRAPLDSAIPRYESYSRIAGQYPVPGAGLIVIEADGYSSYSEDGQEKRAEIYSAFAGSSGSSVLTGENALIEFVFEVETGGFYDLELEYYPLEGKSAEIQRGVFLDKTLPYRELGVVELRRVWTNNAVQAVVKGTPVSWAKDNQGNDLKPEMLEERNWYKSFLYDREGYVTGPLGLWLGPGSHTLSLLSLREPALLRRITFTSASQPETYAAVKAARDREAAATRGQAIPIEAEEAARSSSPTLYPLRDHSAPSVSPVSPRELLNNSIGGSAWSHSSQWLEWDFEAAESGYYLLDMHVKQNFKRGMYVTRSITIDGAAPFAELLDYGFTYGQNWRVETLSDPQGVPYQIYLEAGKHSLRMETVLGSHAELVRKVRDAVGDMNVIYRRVIRLTGVNPDKWQDYQIERNLPELGGEFDAVRRSFDEVIQTLRTSAGRQGERERALVTMRDQLLEFAGDPDRVSQVLDIFKTNISACGQWLGDEVEQPLQLDRLLFRSPDVKPMSGGAHFFSMLLFELQRLFYSYVVDYTKIGNVAGSRTEPVTLWIGSGRDQAELIKAMIDDTFSPGEGISVNVQLVDMGSLLQATLSGQGPDIAIQLGDVTTSLTYGQRYGQIGGDLPVNYGLRNAVMNLRDFDDFWEVRGRFAESAMTANEFGGATYALPETQSFPMMFYRKDILRELGLELPETWDDVRKAISVLARSQMIFGLAPGEGTFAMLLYQNGGEYYNADASLSALDSAEAIAAFRQYCEFYTDYRLDREMGQSAAGGGVSERFRTGEAPIVISDLGLYNELQVSAPDLKGLWAMTPIPGQWREDGRIDRSAASGGTSAVILKATKREDAAWRFLKWWTSADTQLRYGREMESLLGAAARVPTANLEAFVSLPWPAADLGAIQEQRRFVRGIPQVPGGYISFRNVNNAFFLATTGHPESFARFLSGGTNFGGKILEEPEEALMDKIILINDEIRYKRLEFGLSAAENRMGGGAGAE
jgi:ABC-type glycerol-3-phosphate transport system substrate-binding protein